MLLSFLIHYVQEVPHERGMGIDPAVTGQGYIDVVWIAYPCRDVTMHPIILTPKIDTLGNDPVTFKVTHELMSFDEVNHPLHLEGHTRDVELIEPRATTGIARGVSVAKGG